MTCAIKTSEHEWFRQSARVMIAKHGIEKAQRVADFHRRKPLPFMEFYPDIIEEEIAVANQYKGDVA